MSEALTTEDQLVLDAAIHIERDLRLHEPSVRDHKGVALRAAMSIETAGMLCPAPPPADAPCGSCGHEGALHRDACCRGEGPPAYGSCKCARWVARRAS